MSTTNVSVPGIGNDPTTGVIQPKFKVSFQALLHDFWDSTNQRYTSGVLVTTLFPDPGTGPMVDARNGDDQNRPRQLPTGCERPIDPHRRDQPPVRLHRRTITRRDQLRHAGQLGRAESGRHDQPGQRRIRDQFQRASRRSSR